ncbi:MAG TPA: putative toxin-antitoxin system toxin component, PIN family [Candidatus Methylomirabilis sp.]|nr:putative toxin-antitoxin system toxin component, PIN family [Candidatus Methylomirabilis sp.]
MSIFLDTNVLASAIATRGLCTELVEGIITNHELFICEQVLRELQRVLHQKFHLPRPVIQQYLGLLRAEGDVVAAPRTMPRLRIKDPDDVPILACAIAAKVDVFVTGAKALLNTDELGGMPILTPRELWQKLTGLG